MTTPAVKKLIERTKALCDAIDEGRSHVNKTCFVQQAIREVEAEEAAPVHPVEAWMDVAKRTGTKFVTEADVDALTTNEPVHVVQTSGTLTVEGPLIVREADTLDTWREVCLRAGAEPFEFDDAPPEDRDREAVSPYDYSVEGLLLRIKEISSGVGIEDWPTGVADATISCHATCALNLFRAALKAGRA